MPNDEEHTKLSRLRTGKSFIELHKWMNEDYKNPDIHPKRHDIIKIPQNLEIVREKFGNKAVEEFLYHIKEDYEKNIVYKVFKTLSAIKCMFFSFS
ncbi:hypothetical protein CMO89_03205 [Candidatus Woesearchaeota archaeon]|nr:hypothetical protein [Candidatus Woesearchaeota archaeon]|tara:strand:+ start:2038 stop:2325 length:288 start_codon:yes stop_codon:yes gene_type:complete